MNPLEKLDRVLDILLQFEGISFLFLMQEIRKRNLHIENQEAMLILKKITKDGYAELISEKGEISGKPIIATCVISFEGKVFIEQGGYVKKEANDNLYSEQVRIENRRNQLNQKLLVCGAIGAALGAIGLVAWEMYKTFSLHR